MTDQPQGGFTKSARIALLSEDQSYFLLTLVRNTEQAKAVKFNLIKVFSNFRKGQQQAADYLPFYHELHDAVKALAAYAKANGSQTETAFFHITYNRLINRACGFAEVQRLRQRVSQYRHLARHRGNLQRHSKQTGSSRYLRSRQAFNRNKLVATG